MINYTFIIPHKNTPELLKKCLDSIPSRDDLEIIVVDNNSSPDIVDFDKYPGIGRSGVRIVRDNNSIGGGGARNTGLALAKGRWVLFADADDYYTEGYLSVLDKYVNKDLDAVYFNFNRIEKGQSSPLPYTLRFLANAFFDGNIASDELKFKLTVPWNKMVKRDLLEKYHVSFEDCVVANDLLYTYQIGYYSRKTIVESAKIYNYVINNNSVSTKRYRDNNYYLCSFQHYFQNNEFYNFIGHPEWKRSFILRFVAILKKNGFLQLCMAISVLFNNYRMIISNRFLFVDRLKQ